MICLKERHSWSAERSEAHEQGLSSHRCESERGVRPATFSAASQPVSTDEQLLAAYANGERTALEELFQRHRSTAYRVAYRHLGQEADALDAVQEGFVKALRHLDGFRGHSSFKTWLMRVMVNTAIDLRRRRSRRRALALDAAWLRNHEQEQPTVPSQAAQGLEEAELRRLLEEALAELPDVHRQTFILHVDGELAYREIAAILDIPIGTVMSRLYHARRKLRAYLFARI